MIESRALASDLANLNCAGGKTPSHASERNRRKVLDLRALVDVRSHPDNRQEFAQHEHVAARLKADFCVADLHASWERGANETMDGLLRQAFPKKMAIESIAENDIELAMHHLSYRARKCRRYRTPHQIFIEQLQLHNPAVALQT